VFTIDCMMFTLFAIITRRSSRSSRSGSLPASSSGSLIAMEQGTQVRRSVYEFKRSGVVLQFVYQPEKPPEEPELEQCFAAPTLFAMPLE